MRLCEHPTKELTKGLHAITLDKSALLELTEALSSADDGQLMRRLLHAILQALIDAEAAQHIGADPRERADLTASRALLACSVHIPGSSRRSPRSARCEASGMA